VVTAEGSEPFGAVPEGLDERAMTAVAEELALGDFVLTGGQVPDATQGEVLLALTPAGAEAFIGDVVRPLKQLLPQYRAIEARLQAAIHQRFDVTVDNATHRIIREIDNAILKAEREQLFADLPPHDWSSLRGVRAIGLDLTSDVFIRSREQFLAAAERLGVR
jgi:hypothetical protein